MLELMLTYSDANHCSQISPKRDEDTPPVLRSKTLRFMRRGFLFDTCHSRQQFRLAVVGARWPLAINQSRDQSGSPLAVNRGIHVE